LLAQREHLGPVAKCETPHAYTLDEIENLLRSQGPIFFYWQKSHGGNTYGHASVLIGMKSETSSVIYHDPENAPNSTMTVGNFNAKRQRWKYALMQRKGAGSAITARAKMFGG
jgi:hypothetical protein